LITVDLFLFGDLPYKERVTPKSLDTLRIRVIGRIECPHKLFALDESKFAAWFTSSWDFSLSNVASSVSSGMRILMLAQSPLSRAEQNFAITLPPHSGNVSARRPALGPWNLPIPE
jgi:hypothetical protein